MCKVSIFNSNIQHMYTYYAWMYALYVHVCMIAYVYIMRKSLLSYSLIIFSYWYNKIKIHVAFCSYHSTVENAGKRTEITWINYKCNGANANSTTLEYISIQVTYTVCIYMYVLFMHTMYKYTYISCNSKSTLFQLADVTNSIEFYPSIWKQHGFIKTLGGSIPLSSKGGNFMLNTS